jgi:NH3-dependent NAD+ synthetase
VTYTKLRPKDDNDAEAEHSQLDEEEMGMTYEELGNFGKL